MYSYEGKDLSDVDKKLLRGLHEKNIEDPDEYKDKMMAGVKNFMLQELEHRGIPKFKRRNSV